MVRALRGQVRISSSDASTAFELNYCTMSVRTMKVCGLLPGLL